MSAEVPNRDIYLCYHRTFYIKYGKIWGQLCGKKNQQLNLKPIFILDNDNIYIDKVIF